VLLVLSLFNKEDFTCAIISASWRTWTPFEGDFVGYAFQGLKPWATLFALRAIGALGVV
jgi:hypothetical protein